MAVEIGSIGIADVSGSYDGYSLCRAVKPSTLGKMWMVEVMERDFETRGVKWGRASRRKINVWHPIGEQDPAAVYQALRDQMDALYASLKIARENHHAKVKSLAVQP